MTSLARSLLHAALAACAAAAHAQPVSSQTRGELLYNNHCIECHTTQMHWRARKQARDWPSLLGQVQRWQATAGLQWSESDITDVARYLDKTFYHFEPGSERVGSAGDVPPARVSGIGPRR